ncbi:endoplasmic reticulum export factor secretory 16 isoform X2 [Rhodnius prolixus]|uniref:endoplasmic reticulum export factor secretory 16 isoform X2 n=1 Tax=Rhodnius prolixus TaxID=13249 RepID=UPI003D188C28
MNHSEQDPWTWGYEDSTVEDIQHNEWNAWNTCTPLTSDNKKNKDNSNKVKHPPNQGSEYFDTFNLRNTSQNVQHNWTSGDAMQPNYANFVSHSNTSNYFNNNCQTDVENKEVAPPDNQYNRNSHQPPLPEDSKRDRHIQEQMTVPTSQFNQKKTTPIAAPLLGPSFGSKQFDPQDNMFQQPVKHPNSMSSAVANVSYNPVGQHYSTTTPYSKEQSFYFPSSLSHEGATGFQAHSNSLSDLPSRQQNESNNSLSGPQSLPPFHSSSVSSLSNNSTDHIIQHSSSTSSTISDAFHTEKSRHAHAVLPLNDNSSQNKHQQMRDLSQTGKMKSHFSQQNVSSKEQASVFSSAVADKDVASNRHEFSTHSSSLVDLAEDVSNFYHPSKQEIKEGDQTQLQQQLDFHGSHKSEPPQVSNQMSAFKPSLARPPLIHQMPVSDSQQISVSQHLPVLQQPPFPQSSADPQHRSLFHHVPASQLHHVPQQHTSQQLAVNQSLPTVQQSPISQHLPVSQGPTIDQHTPVSQNLPVSQDQNIVHHPSISQHLPVSQDQNIVHHPPISQQLPVSQDQNIVHHPSISQHLPVSQDQNIVHHPPISQHLPVSQDQNIVHYPPISQHLPLAQHQSVAQQPSNSLSHHLLVSQQPLITADATIPHQSLSSLQNSVSQHVMPQSHPHSQQTPVSHYLMASQQPSGPQQPSTSSLPVPTSQQSQISQESPDFLSSPSVQQTQVSQQLTISQQSQDSNNVQENPDTKNFFSNLCQRDDHPQEIIMPDSQKIETNNLKLLQNVSVRNFNSISVDDSQISQVDLLPNSQQRDKDTTLITQNSNNSLTELRKEATETVQLDNDTSNFNANTSRNQMSFNFQNVHPVASSSPVPSHNIPDNQERLPENHELPDNTENLHLDMKQLTLKREVESDSQIHCQVDRNQYLETGHLSGSKDHILSDNSPNFEAVDEGEAPPPGLHRLVTGQGCETRGPKTISDHQLLMVGADSTIVDDHRQSSLSSSTVGSVSDNRNAQNGPPVGESEVHTRTGRLVQGQSIGDDTDGVREVPGEATPFQNRIVLGQMGRGITPPLVQDNSTTRGDNSREREIVGRMVLGERYDDRDLTQNVNSQDDFRQSHRSLRRSRRGESSYEDEEHDYPSDRDRRVDEYKRRGDDRVRHRNRREHRSPEYRSDEEFEDRRGFSRMGRSERRPREFSPDMSYYNNSYYRDDHRRHRRYDHYRDDYDDYYYRENRSRPSSRTGSDYRRMNMDYYSGRVNARPMFYSDLVGAIPYNPRAPEEYFEAMRRLDPMGYAAWYNQYMNSRYNVQQSQSNYNNDRASVHSGQSSTNNQRPNVETPQAGVGEEIGRDEEEFVPATAHIKGIIDNYGRLVVIDPNYSMDSKRRNINIYQISKLQSDPDLDEFLESPGPFIPGVTHRNTVLQYLKRISERSTKSSEKLLYDLVHLSVKSNGELNGLDVADLLMESYKKSQSTEAPNLSEPLVEQISSTDALTKFRELLQQGNKTEALEWAIDHGAWGHALFLASKMDERTHNNIMLRFANSIPHNDPLQTLYQLMSGHVPQASTCCADKKWSDWRPHLAMILGNPTGNTKLDRKAIIKLGDSLFSRGRLFASHFCYVTAQAEFTSYDQEAKFVLLGSNPNQEFTQFASCRAIMLTMCYEYGLKLRQVNANIPSLQLYKLIMATRLIDSGKNRNALQYCEMVANEAVRNECCERPLIACVIDLSSKLKMLDPALALTGDVETDPDWLAKLKNFYDNLPEDYDAGLAMRHGVSSSTVSEVGQEIIPCQQEKLETNEEMVNTYSNEPSINKVEYSLPPPQPIHLPLQPPLSGQMSLPPELVHQEEQQQTYQPSSLPPLGPNTYSAEPFPQQSAVDPYWSSSNGIPTSNSYSRHENVESVSSSKNNFFKASEEQLKLNDISKESNRNNKISNDNKATKNDDAQQNAGWFGGIWEKLSIRPKNQMRLPDDNNPSIIWDEKKKKWVNLESDDDGQQTVKPPPRMAETVNKPQQLSNEITSSAAPLPTGNKYKIQKGKLMKSNYVNIMGSSSTSQSSTVRPIDGLFPTPAQTSNTNFFVPPPAEGNEYPPVDFINPGAMAGNNQQAEGTTEIKQLSRCSSVSSLSREVQYYMAPRNSHRRPPDFPQGITAPTMYNPVRYPISNDC